VLNGRDITMFLPLKGEVRRGMGKRVRVSKNPE
jgi:hypothetical protein